MLKSVLSFFASNTYILGFVSIFSLLGFLLTVFVAIRTNKISKIIHYNKVTEQYNEERLSFQKSFEGHRITIIKDNIKSDLILKDILRQVEEYRVKFDVILTIKERITLFCFIRILKKESKEVDWNIVCNYLAKLSGRLSKKEDKKNG